VQRAIRQQERVLGDIFSGVGLRDHPQGDIVDLSLVQADESIERIDRAPLRLGDQALLVWGRADTTLSVDRGCYFPRGVTGHP
jgi:hypothetical protein